MSAPLFSAPVLVKARRLLEDHHVSVLADDTYMVDGDHGAYVVVTDGRQLGVCTCPASVKGCAHLCAVLLAKRDGIPLPVEAPAQPADPFVGIA